MVTFVNTQLDESTSSVNEVIERERNIVSQFRRLRGTADLDWQAAGVADTLNIELRQLGLDIEIIELRERESVWPFS